MIRKRFCWRICSWLLAIIFLANTGPYAAQAKGYSSGGHSSSSHSSGSSHSYSSSGHSYSSGGSSHSFSSSGGSSRSSSSGGSSKSFSSGGKSYSAGSSRDDSNRHGYSSGKSYGAGTGSSTFWSKPPPNDAGKSTGASSSKSPSSSSRPDSSFSFDSAAARAQKEQASKADYSKYKESKSPPVIPSDSRSTASRPPSSPSSGGGGSTTGTWRDNSRRTYVYVPDTVVIRTRPTRIYNVFGGYYYRPWVTYNDPYSSLFWWWLLDRSIDDQAWWAYHHRYDMDPYRYQTLLANNQQLEARVAQLEAQQVPRDPSYTPTGLDRDLMYSDHYVTQAYSNRPTRSGSAAFWVLGVPLALGFSGFLVWLIWFKRWQTVT